MAADFVVVAAAVVPWQLRSPSDFASVPAFVAIPSRDNPDCALFEAHSLVVDALFVVHSPALEVHRAYC